MATFAHEVAGKIGENLAKIIDSVAIDKVGHLENVLLPWNIHYGLLTIDEMSNVRLHF